MRSQGPETLVQEYCRPHLWRRPHLRWSRQSTGRRWKKRALLPKIEQAAKEMQLELKEQVPEDEDAGQSSPQLLEKVVAALRKRMRKVVEEVGWMMGEAGGCRN